MPESFFSQKRYEMEIKGLLGSSIPNSFRDIAIIKEKFLSK